MANEDVQGIPAAEGQVAGGQEGVSGGQVASDAAVPADTSAATSDGQHPVEGGAGSGGTAAATSVMDWLRQSGHTELAGKFQDERQLVSHLLTEQQRLAQEREQLRHYAEYGRQVLPHWSEYQKWQQSQRQQPAETQKEGPWWSKFWSPPEYDPSMEGMIRFDADGNPAPGTPLELVQKRQQYIAYKQAQAAKFLDNPFQFFEEPVKTLAQQVAEEVVRQHLGQHQATSFAQQYTQQNADWLYARDEQGNPVVQQVFDPDQGGYVQQRALSPAGQRFKGYIEDLSRSGITDPRLQQTIAERLVQADMIMAQMRAGQVPDAGASQVQGNAGVPPQPQSPGPGNAPAASAQQTSEQQKQQFLKQQASSGGGFSGRTPPEPPAGNPGARRKSFSEIAKEVARENGVKV